MQEAQPFLGAVDVDGLTYVMLRHFGLSLTELKSMKVRTVLKLVKMFEDEVRALERR